MSSVPITIDKVNIAGMTMRLTIHAANADERIAAHHLRTFMDDQGCFEDMVRNFFVKYEPYNECGAQQPHRDPCIKEAGHAEPQHFCPHKRIFRTPDG